ncbi:MAG: Uma2 family endonuclease [Pyrinomonadaceae bacterium]
MATILEQPTISEEERERKSSPEERLFTVDEYYRMGEAGVFDDDGQVELLNGRIYKLSPKNPLHSATVRRAGKCIEKRVGKKGIVRTQEPIHFDDYSEPEPDVALVKPRRDEYSKSHPTPEDCLLLLEVSLTTLRHDRNTKSRVYAAAGIKQYLILNLRTRELEDYRDPHAEGYRTKHTYSVTETFNLAAFPDAQIKVSELLPRE